MSRPDGPRRKWSPAPIAILAVLAGLLVPAAPGGGATGAGRALGQASAAPAPIPGPGFAAGWTKAGPLRTFTGQDLFNQIDGGAELFLEFGFARLRLQAYARDKAELTLNAYEMEGAASALGVYLMKMGRETPFLEVAARNSSEEAQMTIVKGRYFVQVDNLGEAPASRAEAAALANAFLAGVADEPARTPLELLPADDRIAGTERLIRGPYGLQPYFTFGEGDILSLGGRTFGALAGYRTPAGAAYNRLIVPYPDAAAATAALAHLKANLDPYIKITGDRSDGFDFVDFQAKKGSVTRAGSKLDIRFNVPDPETLVFGTFASAQTAIAPDLAAIPGGTGWTVFNRTVTVTDRDGRPVAEFDARPGDGLARLDGVVFTSGEIECDIQGRSAPVQGSFVGIAFGVRDAETFDAVYFRPFNFRSENAGGRSRSVQYVSHPDWTWGRLRQERPGEFEKAIEPAPDGDRWIHVRIVVRPPEIRVFVDGAAEPCLTVQALSGPRTGSVALWVGNNSPGRFAGLKITPAPAEPRRLPHDSDRPQNLGSAG